MIPANIPFHTKWFRLGERSTISRRIGASFYLTLNERLLNAYHSKMDRFAKAILGEGYAVMF
jgi:hypothetical protein